MRKIVILIALVTLFIGGCTPANSPTGTTAPVEPSPEIVETVPADVEPSTQSPVTMNGGTITRAITTEPTTLDPRSAAASGQNVILPYLLDTLVYRDLDNSYSPYLAKEWTVSEDGLTVTFILKPGILFHDGTPLNAEAVEFTYQRARAEGSKSPLVSSFGNVLNIEAVGEDQVVFTLKQPAPNLLSALSTAYAGIVSPTAVGKQGDQFGLNPVGSGAFRFENWVPGESIILVRNEDFRWGPAILENQEAAYLDKLVFRIVPDSSTQLSAFQAGEVDILFINQPSQISVLSTDPNASMVETTLNSLIYLGFNVRQAPFDNLLVRKAIAQAIDKTELVELALGGVGTPAFSPIAPTIPGFDPALQSLEPAYDLEASAALLTEAGYTRQGDGTWKNSTTEEPLTLEILTSTRPPNETLATVVQDQLKRIGIPVTINLLESTAVSEISTKGEYQSILWRYDWNDADVLNVYLSSSRIGRTNRTFYSNPDLDRILDAASVELEEAKRFELYSQAQTILIQNQPWIPLYSPKDYIVMRKSIDGAVFGPMGRLVLNEARILP